MPVLPKAEQQAVQLREESETAELEAIIQQTPMEARRLRRGPLTGRWLNIIPKERNDTGLTATEFRDSFPLRLGLPPLGLPQRCDGCGAPFNVSHALQCKKGNLVSLRHDDLKAEWESMLAEALAPSLVRDEPYIRGRALQGPPPANHAPDAQDLRGDIAAHGFWSRGIDTIFDVSIAYPDCSSYLNRTPQQVLEGREKRKRRTYGQVCEEQRRHFTPLVYSTDGMVAAEAACAQQHLAKLLSTKWNRSHSACCGYVSAKISVALVRSTSLCLRNSRVYKTRPQQVDYGAGRLMAVL